MKRVLGSVLVSSEQIRQRTIELGRQISQDYIGRDLAIVAILKGSFIFLADLIRQVHHEIPIEVDFLSVSSYGNDTRSSGTLRVDRDVEFTVAGRDVIIVEDIVDSGLTLNHVYRLFTQRGAQSIRVATLLEKPGNSKYERKLDYVGFQIPNDFVVGYGLDYAQRYRNLPDIRVLDEI